MRRWELRSDGDRLVEAAPVCFVNLELLLLGKPAKYHFLASQQLQKKRTRLEVLQSCFLTVWHENANLFITTAGSFVFTSVYNMNVKAAQLYVVNKVSSSCNSKNNNWCTDSAATASEMLLSWASRVSICMFAGCWVKAGNIFPARRKFFSWHLLTIYYKLPLNCAKWVRFLSHHTSWITDYEVPRWFSTVTEPDLLFCSNTSNSVVNLQLELSQIPLCWKTMQPWHNQLVPPGWFGTYRWCWWTLPDLLTGVNRNLKS